MSEPERSDRGAMTESPTLLPGHGAVPTERVEKKQEAPEVVSTVEPNGSAPPGATDRPPVLDENGLPKKRRRRGSRGGRGRKKPGTPTATGESGRAASSSADSRVASGGEDWTDAAADRGLTAEDAGDQAREDAGLSERGAAVNAPRAPRPQAPPAPRVGDTRPGTPAPAPAAGDDEAPAKKRRRRRGGRGRSKGGGADRGESPRPESPRPAGGGRKPATPSYVDAGLPLTYGQLPVSRR